MLYFCILLMHRGSRNILLETDSTNTQLIFLLGSYIGYDKNQFMTICFMIMSLEVSLYF